MRKPSSNKKAPERRKRPRARPRPAPTPQAASEEACQNCGRDLSDTDRALFVEEEVGRVFCSEPCIAAFFSPDIERLEKEYFRKVSKSDLAPKERGELAHLRWVTLQEPDEVWREKTLTGDSRYTLIAEFQPGDRPVWCVCICLFLRGEPSFLYLAFPTANAALVSHYRKGERIRWVRTPPSEAADTAGKRRGPRAEPEAAAAAASEAASEPAGPQDRLADGWTEDETFLAQMSQERREDDIPAEEFARYEACLEQTLETPDEVWSLKLGGDEAPMLYHFIRHYPDKDPASSYWFLIIARETEDEEQLELLDTFPTRDAQLVERYRRGEQEIGTGGENTTSVTRVVH